MLFGMTCFSNTDGATIWQHTGKTETDFQLTSWTYPTKHAQDSENTTEDSEKQQIILWESR